MPSDRHSTRTGKLGRGIKVLPCKPTGDDPIGLDWIRVINTYQRNAAQTLLAGLTPQPNGRNDNSDSNDCAPADNRRR